MPAVERESVVEPVAVCGVEQRSLDVLPAGLDGFVGEVGVELEEVARMEPQGIVAGDQGLLIVFAIEDQLSIRPGDRDVGDHYRVGSTGPVIDSLRNLKILIFAGD